MPTKKKVKTKKEIKPSDDQTVANINAIGALTEIAASQTSRMDMLENRMKEIIQKLGQVLSRLGL